MSYTWRLRSQSNVVWLTFMQIILTLSPYNYVKYVSILLNVLCRLTDGKFGVKLTRITAKRRLNARHARISVRKQIERREI